MRTLLLLLSLSLPLADAVGAGVEESSWLRSENEHVREGNAKLKAGDAKAALSAYDRAARELPSEGGVHLDRGLALLKSGQLPQAREALRLATQPPAAKPVRADAYYDLGNAFYKEADTSAGADDHEQAQKSFREAADAFKQALRLRPGDRNAAWNFELAQRRIREQEQKQKEKQEQQKQDEQKDQQNQDQQNQDQQNQDQQNQDQQKQDQQKQDQQKQDQQKQDQPKPDQQQQDQQEQQPNQPDEQQPTPLPREAERALDALDDTSDNLERLRAAQRAARERREPEKDW